LDIATFSIATANLTLATFNTVQISKMETEIAAQDENIDQMVKKQGYMGPTSKLLMKKLTKSVKCWTNSCKWTKHTLLK
jgi:hypothetical protein